MITKLEDLINPQVMADIINGTLPHKLRFTPFAKVDRKIRGQAGDTITIPSWEYIGDAEDVAEGASITPTKLVSSTKSVTVKKVMKGVELTKEAIQSGYGDSVGQTSIQLAMAMASKIDADCITALEDASLVFGGSGQIGYNGIVDMVDKLQEEDFGVNKVLFVHPNQVTTIRKDKNFLDINQYPTNMVMTGVIGSIAGCQVVTSKRIKNDGTAYDNFIMQTSKEKDELAALSIYLKSDVEVLTDIDIYSVIAGISANTLYTAALTNPSKVVKGNFAV